MSCAGSRPPLNGLSSATPALEAMLATLLVGAEGLDEAALPLRDEHGLAVTAAEGKIGRLPALQGDLALDRAIGLHQRDRPLEDARDIETTGHVGAQTVDGIGLECLEELCAGELIAVDRIGPDLTVAGFAD